MIGAAFEVGFIFWGLFAVFLAIFAGYAVWMIGVERREERRRAQREAARGDAARPPDPGPST